MTKTVGFLMLRAQPLHAGHKDLIRQSYKQCDKLLILVGSANSPRTIKNPFTYLEREAVISRFIDFEYSGKADISVFPVNDYVYSNPQWMSDVSLIVSENSSPDDKVVLFGHMKIGNDYLGWFPQYESMDINSAHDVAATGIREHWFENQRHHFTADVLADWDYFKAEKVLFGSYPFPEELNFCCSDALYECNGHILLVQRKRAPGRNTWALPGGFKKSRETFLQGTLREAGEETNIRIPEKVLLGSIVKSKLYDSPNRGMGLPRITVCTHIRVAPNPDGSFPRVSPRDDALKTGWFPTQTVLNDMELFDDHPGIVSEMTGVVALPAHKNPRFMAEKRQSIFQQ